MTRAAFRSRIVCWTWRDSSGGQEGVCDAQENAGLQVQGLVLEGNETYSQSQG